MNLALKVVNEKFSSTHLNEGAWGYEPDQNDGALDLRGDIFRAICKLVYEKCEEGLHKGTDYSWEALGNVEFFFESLSDIPDFGIGDKDFEKYYYWWRLNDLDKKNIVELYGKLLKQCKSDKKWISGWSEPEKMEKSLKKREKNFEKYQKLLDARTAYEKKMDKERESAAKDVGDIQDN